MDEMQWRIAFQVELEGRGGTDAARRELVEETPDWLLEILGMESPRGKQPVDCTCARWYVDGTHTAECRHKKRAGDELRKPAPAAMEG